MPRRLKPVPTIADVARECGVGSMTVSRVMNGKKHVSVAMTQRVRAAIIKLGYEPNEAATSRHWPDRSRPSRSFLFNLRTCRPATRREAWLRDSAVRLRRSEEYR